MGKENDYSLLGKYSFILIKKKNTTLKIKKDYDTLVSHKREKSCGVVFLLFLVDSSQPD